MNRLTMLGLCVSMIAVGCAHPDDSRCQLRTEAGACLSVVNVTPWYSIISAGEGYTPSVDVVAGSCETGSGAVPEPFAAHAARITIESIMPSDVAEVPELAPAVTFTGYEVDYFVADCTEQVCPALDPLVVPGETFSLKAGETLDLTVALMPLSRKQDYINLGGGTRRFPAYSAQYTLRGNDGDADFELEAWTQFVVGNFDLCDAAAGM